MHFRRPKWLHSLAFRILLAYVAGVLLSIGLLVGLGAIAQERLPGMGMPERTLSLAKKLAFDSTGRPVGFNDDQEHPLWIYNSLRQETAYRVLDETGTVVLLSPGAENWPQSGDIARLERWRFEIEENGVVYEGATERIEHGGKTWFVQLTASSRMIDFLHQEFAIPFIRFGIFSLGMILLFVFGACAYISLKYSLRPLRKASLAAADISPKSLNERLQEEQVPLEIAPLISSFNAALDRIENGFRIQQDFLAKAAHELKTPLALIRAEVDLMENCGDIREPLLSHVEHLTRHVQQLLLLAEASEPLSYQFSDVDAREIAHDVVSFLSRIADESSINLTIASLPEALIWHADRGAFFTLLKNMVENAIQHAPPGTEVRTTIKSDGICVRDWGAGVVPEQLPLMFSRFWRGAHRRDHGAGLGLSICQEICAAHGWTLSAENANPGLVVKVSAESSGKRVD
ncbi:ATP-binding protein [Vreelandella olivaria]|uniref:ATP-binding protein n=1 Tax=Vreelandella olivaria TaxID=390919 RepID=UPI00201FAF63|nr:ATP-binding protein [Halomonas olivaria]